MQIILHNWFQQLFIEWLIYAKPCALFYGRALPLIPWMASPQGGGINMYFDAFDLARNMGESHIEGAHLDDFFLTGTSFMENITLIFREKK